MPVYYFLQLAQQTVHPGKAHIDWATLQCRLSLGLCRSKVLITASGGARGKKSIPLKQIADRAAELAAKDGFKVRFTAS